MSQSITQSRFRRDVSETDPRHLELVQFVLDEQARMPDYLKLPFQGMIVLFNLSGILRSGRPFSRQDHERRQQQVARWSNSAIAPCREFIFFYETFVLFYWYTQEF